MQFKAWLLKEQYNTSALDMFLNGISTQVLKNVNSGDGYIRFRFPLYNTLENTRKLLAASTNYFGDLFSEVAEKGLATQKNYLRLIQSPEYQWNNTDKQRQSWAYPDPKTGSPTQKSLDFRQALNTIQIIPGPMGLLFEIEVYLACMKYHSLMSAPGDNLQHITSQRELLKKDIQGKVEGTLKRTEPLLNPNETAHNASEAIFDVIFVHARDMATRMVQMSRKILNCEVDQVHFLGGTGSINTLQGRANPADIMISCSKIVNEKMKNKLGWNLKFGSKTRIQVAELQAHVAISTMAKMVGIKNWKQKAKEIKSIPNDPFKQEGETNSRIILNQLIEISSKYENNPDAFVGLLNILIHGGNFTLPAMRNYITTPSDAGYSPNFKKYFNIKEDGVSIRPRGDAIVNVRGLEPNTSVIVLTYTTQELADKEGVQIFVEPQFNDNTETYTIEFKVTNMTSDIIRKKSNSKIKKNTLPF